MKKIVCVLGLITLLPVLLLAQSDTINTKQEIPDSLKKWKFSGTLTLTTNQASYTNWSAGGETAFSVNSLLLYTIDYKNKKAQWNNTIKLGYGLVWKKDEDREKGDDIIDFTSKFGYKSFNKWYYSIIAGFNSQFDKGYNSDSVLISEFMAPGYLALSIGMDYKPNDNFSLLIAPLSGKITFVRNDSLANAGAFGVDAARYDEMGVLVTNGTHSKPEFGGAVKVVYQKEVLKNVKLSTKLDLFSNYLENPENIDVNWEVDINLKVNKFLTATVSTKMIYDDDIKIGEDDNDDGAITSDEIYPRLQFKEVIGVGLSLSF